MSDLGRSGAQNRQKTINLVTKKLEKGFQTIKLCLLVFYRRFVLLYSFFFDNLSIIGVAKKRFYLCETQQVARSIRFYALDRSYASMIKVESQKGCKETVPCSYLS